MAREFIIGCMTAVVIISLIIGGIYAYHRIEVDNFQKTIKDLNNEQKCLHICGFEFGSMLENYKFCAEKCDRISEREREDQRQ